MKSKFINFLRWVAVLPGAILSLFVVRTLADIVLAISSFFNDPVLGVNPIISNFCDYGVAVGFASATAVVGGSYIAPNVRGIVAIVLAVLFSFFFLYVASTSESVAWDGWTRVVGGGSALIGATLGALYVFEEVPSKN